MEWYFVSALVLFVAALGGYYFYSTQPEQIDSPPEEFEELNLSQKSLSSTGASKGCAPSLGHGGLKLYRRASGGGACPTLCEQIADARDTEIVDCIEDAGKTESIKDLICEPCDPCPLGYSVQNTEEEVIVSGIINNPCDEPSLLITIPDVTYYDCNGDLQTAPYPNVPDTPINEPCPPCNPVLVNFAGYPLLEITDPCGSVTDIGCNDPMELWKMSGAEEEELNEWYIVKGEGAYVNEEDDTIQIVWSGVEWQIRQGETTLYTAPGTGTNDDITQLVWVAAQGQSTTPTIEQVTISDLCCEPCPTLCELLGEVTPENVVEDVYECLTEAAQEALVESVCDCPDWGCPKLATHTTFVDPHPATGHIYRFTGTTFGYKIGATYYDKDGATTTEALAFPDNIVIDWSQAKFNSIGAMSRVLNNPVASGQVATVKTNVGALTHAGYSDWQLCPADWLFQVTNRTIVNVMDFDPYNYVPGGGTNNQTAWCEDVDATDPTGVGWAVGLTTGAANRQVSSGNRGCYIYRNYTNAQLGF